MAQNGFPPLALADWRPTRDTLHRYARILGAIRGVLTPQQGHWWHISLRVVPEGLTTTSIPFGDTHFSLSLDLSAHRLTVQTGDARAAHISLTGQPAATLGAQIRTALEGLGIRPDIGNIELGDPTPGHYDRAAAECYGRALQRIDATFKRFRDGLEKDTSPVQLWPHHFDLAVSWFSGRQVPGTDPTDEETSEEQMNFGFSTGDDGIPDPYFYITAYPVPASWLQTKLPPGATWHTRSWTGAVMPYAALTDAEDPEEKLLGFLRNVQAAGAGLMRPG